MINYIWKYPRKIYALNWRAIITHSYLSHYYHLVWATKNRKNIITAEIQHRLYAYLGGIIRDHSSCLLEIGGTENHVHLLVASHMKVKFSDFIKNIKAKSCLWIHRTFQNHQEFSWQEGYGSFTISFSSINTVINYIKNQEKHHKIVTFEDEYLKLLKKHDIKFDDRFVLG